MAKYQKVTVDKRKSLEHSQRAALAVKKLWGNPEYRKSMSDVHKGKYYRTEAGKKSFAEKMSGSNHPMWISDRNLVKKREQRNDSSYCAWRREVWKRDNFKCKIANKDCEGRIEAHHILSWRDYKDLRYETNNGITLCKFHHPRKKTEENRLSPYFQQLINNL